MLFASILNSSVMLGNYLQQTTSADNIFRCIFFLAALRAKIPNTFLFLFSNKMLLFKAGIHKMLDKISNREDPDQTASSSDVL